MTKSLEKIIISRDFVVLLFPGTFEYGKCLKTGEMTKSLEKMIISRDFVVLLFLNTFELTFEAPI